MTDICLVHGGDLAQPSGGTDRVSAFAAGLDAHGYDVAVVVPQPSGMVPERLASVEIISINVGTRGLVDQPLRAIKLARKARAVADARDAKLQIEHATLAGAADLLGTSFDVLDMHDLSFRSPLYGDLPLGSIVQRAIKHVEGRALSEAAEVVVVSQRMADLIGDEWHISTDSITVIPNGYFPEVVEPYQDTEPVDGRVVFLGTLHPKMDVDALRNIAMLSNVTECIVIGDGPQRETLEETAATVEDLHVTGRLPDEEAFSLLASATVAVNPQHASDLQAASSPVKLFYYAALGCPMVLTEGPEFVEELAHSGAAISVEPGAEFAESVDTLLDNSNHRKEMHEAARQWGKRTTWHRRVERLSKLYAAKK